MHFTQIALLLSGVVAIDASPLPNNAAARSFKNVSDTVSFYGAAAFEKRQALGVVKGREQVSDDVVSDNTDVVVATNDGKNKLSQKEKQSQEVQARAPFGGISLEDLRDALKPIPDKLVDGARNNRNKQNQKQKQNRDLDARVPIGGISLEDPKDALKPIPDKLADGRKTQKQSQKKKQGRDNSVTTAKSQEEESGGLIDKVKQFGKGVKDFFTNLESRDVLKGVTFANSTVPINPPEGDEFVSGSGAEKDNFIQARQEEGKLNIKTFNITLPNKHLPVVLPDRKEDEPLFDNLMTSVPPTASVASPNRDAIVKRVKPLKSTTNLPRPDREDLKTSLPSIASQKRPNKKEKRAEPLNPVVRHSPQEDHLSDDQPELDDEDLENGNTTIKFHGPITTENDGSAERLVVTCRSSSCDAYKQH